MKKLLCIALFSALLSTGVLFADTCTVFYKASDWRTLTGLSFMDYGDGKGIQAKKAGSVSDLINAMKEEGWKLEHFSFAVEASQGLPCYALVFTK